MTGADRLRPPGVLRRRILSAAGRLAIDPLRRARLQPPIASRSWQPRAPDFVGVGVQRAGTSWWHQLIEAHPAVHPLAPPGKEVHFFDRFWAEEPTADDLASYHVRFKCPPGMRSGEWTPRYVYDPWTPPLLRLVAPDARLLLLLRDPIERFRSGLLHRAARGWNLGDIAATGDAVARGFYATQLDHLLRSFPREQVLVLQYERCRVDPVAELRRTYAFLELDESPAAAVVSEARVVNDTPSAFSLPAGVARTLREVYDAEVSRLASSVDDLDVSLWPYFCDRV